MDLGAVKAAGRTELTACAIASALNAQGLLDDAEVLAARGSRARAYALAVLAVEESGKTGCLAALAVLPHRMRTRTVAGRMLQWHQLKQIGGLLTATVTYGEPGLAVKLASMPSAQATQIVSSLSLPADEADHLRRRSLYVDMDRSGRSRTPSEITDAEVARQLGRARQAVASATLILDPQLQARIANPPAEAMELANALALALTRASRADTPEDATKVMLDAVGQLHGSAADGELDGSGTGK
ncbi:MAG: AbiV family abortive infection protein [Streptosporangiaceae bacterium]